MTNNQIFTAQVAAVKDTEYVLSIPQPDGKAIGPIYVKKASLPVKGIEPHHLFKGEMVSITNVHTENHRPIADVIEIPSLKAFVAAYQIFIELVASNGDGQLEAFKTLQALYMAMHQVRRSYFYPAYRDAKEAVAEELQERELVQGKVHVDSNAVHRAKFTDLRDQILADLALIRQGRGEEIDKSISPSRVSSRIHSAPRGIFEDYLLEIAEYVQYRSEHPLIGLEHAWDKLIGQLVVLQEKAQAAAQKQGK